MSKPTVALMGLGIMGSGMAQRLLSTRFPLVVYNRNRHKSLPFADAGASVAFSPREAASQAQIILSMVADDLASHAVWLGENGALAGASSGAVLIESSTVSIGWIKELEAEAAQRGCNFLDACDWHQTPCRFRRTVVSRWRFDSRPGRCATRLFCSWSRRNSSRSGWKRRTHEAG